MLENCVTTKERWGGVDRIVNELLKERQELLILYCNTCGIQPVTSEGGRSRSDQGRSPARLKKFCDILVDYVSAGHFEVYEQLLREANEFKQDGIGLLARLYPIIERSTELSLAFSDKYAESENYRNLSKDLSILGEALEARFEAEDTLIEALHLSHRAEVA